MSARQVENGLAEARRHRTEGHLEQARQALEVAWEVASVLRDHPLRQIAAWRRAKLAHDLGDAVAALDALAPILEDPDPFEHYPRGLEGCEALARGYWDTVGYGAPRLRRLWERYSEAWAARSDPFLAAGGRSQLAWDLACAGDLDAAAAILEETSALDPARFRRGPTRHPRAADAPSSIPWLQLEVARTCLRAATWARSADLAVVAAELLEDAAEEAGVERASEFWFLEPMALAGVRLGTPGTLDYVPAWQAAAAVLTHERAELHRAIAAAEAARASGDTQAAARTFDGAADLAAARRWGPEWEIDCLCQAGSRLERARALVDDHGVRVFLPLLAGPG